MKETKLVTLSYEISEKEFGDREMTFGYFPDLINLLKNIFTKAELKEVYSFSVKVIDQTRPTKEVYSDLFEATIIAIQDDQHFVDYFLGCEGCEETFDKLEEIMRTEPELFDYTMKLYSFLKEIEQHFDPFEYNFEHHYFKQS